MILNLFAALFCYFIALTIYNLFHSSNEPEKYFLVIDTDTDRLLNSKNKRGASLRLVQITAILMDKTGDELDRLNALIRPRNFSITQAATDVHGISQAHARPHGSDIETVLENLQQLLKRAHVLVAHNLTFDLDVLKSEYKEQDNDNAVTQINQLEHVCTMRETTSLCQIPGRYGYKWPSLSELHEHLFDEEAVVAHTSEADAELCLKCFKELYNKRIVLK